MILERRWREMVGLFAVNRVQFWWQVAGAAAVALYVVSLLVVPHTWGVFRTGWDNTVMIIAGTLPLVPLALRSHRNSPSGATWTAFLLGVAFFDAGNVVYVVHDRYAPRPPSFSLSEMLYLLSYVALVVGVVFMTQRRYGRGLESARLDGAVAGLSIAALGTLFWLDEIRVVRQGPLPLMVGRAYPLLDLVLLVVVVVSLAPSKYRPDAGSALVMASLLIFAAADVAYLHGQVTGAYHPGGVLDGSWALALWLVGLAAGAPEDQRGGARTRKAPTTRGLAAVPIVFSLVSVMTLAIAAIRHSSKVASLFAVCALCVVVVRLALTLAEVRRMEREHYAAARTDELTGLANRRSFIESTEQLLESIGESEQFGVILIDLDGFKEINDSLGHPCGDELLREVGELITRTADDSMAIARLGGDEFAILATYGDFSELVDLANDLVEVIAEPIVIDGVIVRVGASIGVATYPEHGETQVELMRSVDVAMYEAKRSRSAICLYHSKTDDNSRDRLALAGELRRAIDEGELVLHYQITNNFLSGHVHGAEALVRWNHPTRGLLYPDTFIPVAERVGLISSLTRAVLRMALQEMTRLDANGHRLNVSVNISRLDLEEARLPIDLAALLEEYPIEPQRLTLEVTETSLGEYPLRARLRISQLRALGVRISIDDFGVGYSSLSQLLELPIDELKIDRSFVLALAKDARARAVIHSTIGLARALKASVVAEGIETEESYRALRDLGADVAQGIFIGVPRNSAEIDSFFASPLDRVADESSGAPASSWREVPEIASTTWWH